ncbi:MULTISPECIES: NCS2 family permease [Bacillaceae]|uniref:Guanine permease n=1 Tax=Gottfriedia luciferensis TaxID=178774 RepID=A0ABX2ZT16_9BACI|nr:MULTISPECIES: NCS2 family permease [Bacillaceae]ODG92930.1 guanine permease [Gottfriedia luciferensis]PGZ93946.1 NCS2 family permease [Bacillus sp. AFS029533]SFD34282.1 putative MFS transporter, AGZA family, xanthine/uracil permease [Bacillus sp. UNCCL81]
MFKLKEANTSVKTEVIAGFTTFLTMAYIIIVNPIILSAAGVPFDQAFTATIIATLVGTLFMALFGNYPIAIAPGMGMNAYFAYSVVSKAHGISYQLAFSAVFVTGILFVILSLTKFRTHLIEAIPNTLKHAISVGIGLFIAFIGLRLSGIIVANKDNLVGLGDLHSPGVVLTLVGIAITVILFALNVNGALFFGMVSTAIIAGFAGKLHIKGSIFSLPKLPEHIIVANPITAFSDVVHYGLYSVVFSFLLVTIFDTTGTFLGVASQAGLLNKKDEKRTGRAMLSDSLGTTIGAMFGTSPTTAYIESTAGVAAGGRTGLTALVVALLFVFAAFFSPLVNSISDVAAITSPSLIVVGCLMMGSVRHIEWDNFEEAFPAFLVIITMPLTSSIATGIALGFITYPLLKVVKGKAKNVKPVIYIFGILFLIQMVFFPH